MRADLVPGATLPDFELPDHEGITRRLSALQGEDPMVLLLSRGRHCPREQHHHRELLKLHEWCQVAYTRMVTIAANDLHDLNSFKIAVAAPWPFLSDAERVVQRTLDIQEYTDPYHDPLIPHTLVLAPDLRIERIYVGFWFWGRPSSYELWADLRHLFRRIKPDFDPTLPEARAAWETSHPR
jgi:peroxiredoxin